MYKRRQILSDLIIYRRCMETYGPEMTHKISTSGFASARGALISKVQGSMWKAPAILSRNVLERLLWDIPFTRLA